MFSRAKSTPQSPPTVATFDPGAQVTATFETTQGKFVCRLFADKCPMTVGNFVALARGEAEWKTPDGQKTQAPLYNGTLFHRVITDFMIQGGDPQGTGMGGPGYKFGDEFHDSLKHDKPGKLSMANSGPGTNGSQFFVTEIATPWLDGRHTVFGEVSEGMDVVHKIARVECGAQDRPREDVVIKSLTIDVKAS